MDVNDLTRDVISAAIEVHRALGPGLLESAYEECLCRELDLRKIPYERQKELPVEYKGIKLDRGYRLDLLVANTLILELKSCEGLQGIHEAQLLTYLKLTGVKLGLLINFKRLRFLSGYPVSRISRGETTLLFWILFSMVSVALW